VPELRLHTAEPKVPQTPSRHGALSAQENLCLTNSHNTHWAELIEKLQFVSEPRLSHMTKTHQVSHPFWFTSVFFQLTASLNNVYSKVLLWKLH